MKLTGKPHSALLPLRYPLHFVYFKNLHNLKDFCHNDEETGSMAIFHNSQISFKEHQVDTVKEKKKNTTLEGRVKSKFVAFLKLISSFLDILPEIFMHLYIPTLLYTYTYTYMNMC